MKKLLSLFVLVPLLTAGCHHRGMADVQGSGKRQTEKRQVAPFMSISTEGAFDIEVVCQKDLSLEVEGDDNILPFVSSEVSGNVLHLRPTRSYSVSEAPKFKITVPNLEAISATGAGRIQISGMNNEKFQISSDGAPAITASGTTKMIGIDTNGKGDPVINKTIHGPGKVEKRGDEGA